MNLPPINLLSPGPAAPTPSMAAATAPARAQAELGAVLGEVAETAGDVGAKIRQYREAGDRTSFMANLEKEAADFNNGLLRRADYGAWSGEFQTLAAGWRDKASSLGLSPEGQRVLDEQLLEFTTRRQIQLESTAALKQVEDGRARVAASMSYNAATGNMEGIERDLAELPSLGFSESEQEIARRSAMRKYQVGELERLIDEDPDQYTEILPEQFPDILPSDIPRLEARAKGRVQEMRGVEMENLEARAIEGGLDEEQIASARYLTDRDRAEYRRSLKNATPPSKEVFNAAWRATDNLRELRSDPSASQEQYREIFNDTKATVLGTVPLNYQGDLKKELGYLSPAGRDPSSPKDQGVITSEDLNALARGQINRALDASVLGNVGDAASPQEKEAAFRKAEDLRIAAKRFIGSTRGATPEQVRQHIDAMIAGDRTTTAAKKLIPAMPGMGTNLSGRSAGPFGQLPSVRFDDTMVLPPKPEAEQLDDYLDGNRND